MKDKKLKILLINRWVGYNEGGNETHMQGLIKWFTKEGNDVTVITTEGDILEKMPEVTKHYINTPKGYYSYGLLGIINAALFNLLTFIKVLRLHFKGERYDLVSVHFSLEAVLARFIKLFLGYPYVMRLAGDTPLELLEGKRADGAIHVSHFMNEQSIKMGYSAAVIPKGFEFDKFNPNLDVRDLVEKHKTNQNEKILLAVCRLDPRKNLITLIEAMDILVNRENLNDIKLLIVGDGVERQFLENSVARYGLKEKVEFLGKIPNKDPLLPKYYVLADLFVLPTLYEGFGWVYFEAMACGTPVLTTKAGSNLEVVGEDGVLVEPKNPEILAKAIVKTVYNDKLLHDLRQKGLKKATSIPWEKQIKKYEAYYRAVSEKKCNSIACRLTVLGYIVMDVFSIAKNVLSGTIFNKESKKDSVWLGGQAGLK